MKPEHDFREQAWEVLRICQRRDAVALGLNMDSSKDEIVKDLSFGRLALSIPEQHYEILTMIMPELNSPDGTEQTLAWKTFMGMDESLPYKPNKKMRNM